MSVIIAKGEQISKSPINTSTAKQMFSFTKSDRFPKLKNSGATFYYQLPDIKMKRTSSFGYGTKYDFTKEFNNKNCTFYESQTDFDPKKPRHQAWTFGIARSYYSKVYNECDKFRDACVPGPGTYKFVKPFGQDALKFSLFGKGEKKQLSSVTKIPGPGQYPIISLNPQGKYPISKFHNATNIVFGSSKEKRFQYQKSKNPGPGNYKTYDLITGQGKTFVSKFKSSTAKTISGRFKDCSIPKNESKIIITSAPGPGTYRIFSDFGIYESKNAQVFEQKEKSLRSLSAGKV